ncbi:hypothetical protein F7725_024494 [Dissostichus mawsoni]|uniref:Death domain-containing protein n=1 Tax=Dissostichus mawsoni TaxID=36200 RepID=A0A7J5Y0G0_DISMA|nr:hypothetical protein F7725_024494 [Dissostichus mawsoni]
MAGLSLGRISPGSWEGGVGCCLGLPPLTAASCCRADTASCCLDAVLSGCCWPGSAYIISSEPVEDIDTTSFVAEFSLEANYPVQVTDPNDAVTLHLTSMTSGYLSPSSDRIRQPVQDVEECTCPTSTSPDFPKELQLLHSPCEKCCCPAPPPKISDLMNDKDLLDLLRLKLDPNHCTIKNWKNFASRWGMSYDELTLLEHRTQGSLSHSPTQEFLLRYNQNCHGALGALPPVPAHRRAAAAAALDGEGLALALATGSLASGISSSLSYLLSLVTLASDLKNLENDYKSDQHC